MAKRVADLLVDVLLEADVQRIYGVPGDSLNGITDSLRTRESIQWIGMRHEEAAAFAAGPGCIHLHTAPSTTELASKALPHVQVPAQWITQGTRPEAVQSGWLSELKDPALEALAAEALTYNPDLQVAQARVEQSRILMEAAGGALQPTLAAAGKGGGKLGADASGVRGAFLLASWEIDVWGRIRYGRMAASAQYSSAVADAAYARQSLVAKSRSCSSSWRSIGGVRASKSSAERRRRTIVPSGASCAGPGNAAWPAATL